MMSGKMDDEKVKAGETLDDLCGGRIRIFQRKKGYRFSLDAVLLAHFIRLKSDDKTVELGAGSAVVSLILLHRFGCDKIVGLEIQNDLVEMARRSVRLNGFEGRIEIMKGDVREIKAFFPPQCVNVVYFNPPYRKMHSGRVNPDDQKAVARHELRGNIDDFLTAAKYLLKDSGSVFLIYPSLRLVELMHRMRLNNLEPKRIQLVHSKRSSRGEFVLLEGIKGGGEELAVLPPLFIYNESSGYTDDMMKVFSEIGDPHPSSGE